MTAVCDNYPNHFININNQKHHAEQVEFYLIPL